MKTHDTVADKPTAVGTSLPLLLWCTLGLLLPRATLYGELAPFGIGLAGAATTGRWPITLALVAGYLFAQPVSLPLRYVAAIAVVGGARWVAAALPDADDAPLTAPLITLVSTLVTGFVVFGQGGLDGYRIILIVAESIVATASTLFFSVAMRTTARLSAGDADSLTTAGQASLLFVAAVAAMAAATLTVGGFAPGRGIAVLFVLCLARAGRENGGCLAGCVLGTAMALANPDYVALAVGLGLGGMLAGAFVPFGRLAQSGMLFATTAVAALTQPADTAIYYLYEVLAAGILFPLLPARGEQWVAGLFFPGREQTAARGVRRLTTMRLRTAAEAMKDVASTVDQVARRLGGDNSPTAIYKESSLVACEGCPLHVLCWGQHADELTASLEAMTPLLSQQGPITVGQLTGYAAAHCRRKERLVDYINRSYDQYVAREGAWRRLRELQQAAGNQLAGAGTLLAELADDLTDPRQVDSELSDRMMTVCRDFGIAATDALCLRRGEQLTVDILLAGSPPATEGRWLKQIARVCGQELTAPTLSRWGKQTRLTLVTPLRYALEMATAQRLCDGEKLCGDAVETCHYDGRQVVILSDGMGSGGRAAVEGAMAAALTARLWQAGFSPGGTVHSVNAALQVKSRDESLATLDIATIDLSTGRLDSYKAGAATSLLRSAGRVSRVERPSLPLGILTDIAVEHSHDRLVKGDIFLLCSDGVFPGGVAPAEQLLLEAPVDLPLQALADRIADAARAEQTHQGFPQDDITVVAMRLT